MFDVLTADGDNRYLMIDSAILRAFAPRSGRIYLSYGEIKRTEGKPPSLVPASFAVLVVDAR